MRRPGEPTEAERQQQLVAEVDRHLERVGVTTEFLELLNVVYNKKGGGELYAAALRAQDAARAEELNRLYLQQAEFHERLHKLFGRLIPWRVPPTKWLRSPKGAYRTEWDEARSCRLQDECGAKAKEVRAHADFVRWLGRMAEAAKNKKVHKIDPALASKGAFVAFLRRDSSLSHEAIAAFVLVRLERRELPLHESVLEAKEESVRQSLVDDKKRKKRGATEPAFLRGKSSAMESENVHAQSPRQGTGKRRRSEKTGTNK